MSKYISISELAERRNLSTKVIANLILRGILRPLIEAHEWSAQVGVLIDGRFTKRRNTELTGFYRLDANDAHRAATLSPGARTYIKDMLTCDDEPGTFIKLITMTQVDIGPEDLLFPEAELSELDRPAPVNSGGVSDGPRRTGRRGPAPAPIPIKKPDFPFEITRRLWPWQQALMIVCGAAPETTEQDLNRADSELADRHRKLEILLFESIRVRELDRVFHLESVNMRRVYDDVYPAPFVRWVHGLGYPIPDEVQALLDKTRYPDPVRPARPERADSQESPTPPAEPDDALHPKSRNSYNRLLAALLVKHYSLTGEEKKYALADQLLDDLQCVGFQMDPDTLSGIIDSARSEIVRASSRAQSENPKMIRK